MQEKCNYQQIIAQRAEQQANDLAYVFLDKWGKEQDAVTFEQLHHRTRVMALTIQQYCKAQQRVMIVLENSIDYIVAFYACVYTNTIAVTTHVPRTEAQLQHLLRVHDDCQATCMITHSRIVQKFSFSSMQELQNLPVIAVDQLPAQDPSLWEKPQINADDLALLQYTSGSTSLPKGVMVSHDNLMLQGQYMETCYELSAKDVGVSWLPLFHDMGLILGVLQSCYSGFPTYLMEPITFILKPALWLQTVSKYGGTWSAAPNFAFDLCIETYRASHYQDVNLSTWKGVINGAEPVRKSTIERFSERFYDCGFRQHYFNPSYGMAESTLVITAGNKKQPPIFKSLELSQFKQHRVQFEENSTAKTITAVACGKVWLDTQLIVVNSNRHICAAGEIGELWVKGKTVTRGYWQNPTATHNTFCAYLQNGDGPYLRTGDLGFIHEQQVYITGRSKDIIIIRGKNHAPQDIELTVEKCKYVQSNFVAAFSLEIASEEHVVVFAQVKPLQEFDKNTVAQEIFKRVVQEHEVNIFAIAFLPMGVLPKTTSGKIQRSVCKTIYAEQAHTLNVVRNPLFATHNNMEAK